VARIAAGLAVLLIALPVSAQPEEVDIVEQHVEVDLTGAELSIVATATVEVVGWTEGAFVPQPLLRIERARVDGTDVALEPHPEAPAEVAILRYPETMSAGRRFTMELTMRGAPRCAAGLGRQLCFHSEPETILPGVAPFESWYFTNLWAADGFTGTITVHAPASHVVAAGQGAPRTVETVGEVTTWVFDVTHETDMLPLYAGTASVRALPHAGVEAYFQPERDDGARVDEALGVAAEVLGVYADVFGIAPPEPARLVFVPRSFRAGGIGLLGTTFLNEIVIGDADYLLVQGVAHELAHTYFGGFASAARTTREELVHAGFLQEAFAEYAAWRALGEARGEAVRTSGMRMNAVWYMYRRPGDADAPILSEALHETPALVHATYHKGGMVVRYLEELVGRAELTAALRAYVARGYGMLAVEALRQEIESASGLDVGGTLDQWLREAGFPRVTVTVTTRDGGARLRAEVEGDYDLVVPVRATFSNGESEAVRLTLSPGASEHDLVFREPPVLVEIDPSWSHAREIRPGIAGEVTFDGVVDAADMMDVALRAGTFLPEERRVDGGYDPLYDLDGDRTVGGGDVALVIAAAGGG